MTTVKDSGNVFVLTVPGSFRVFCLVPGEARNSYRYIEVIIMERCPFCGSEDIYFSKKKKLYVCEDCDRTFSEEKSSQEAGGAASGRGLELFFSYGHDRNRLLVERMKKDLEKRGHHVWIDTSEIKAGDHWRDDILNGVMKASGVIAFLSEHSTRNPGVCLDELKIAVCVKGADIRTVLLEPENRIKPPRRYPISSGWI